MSTPSAQDPFDLSAYVPQRARGTDAQQGGVEPPPVSPFAPRRGRDDPAGPARASDEPPHVEAGPLAWDDGLSAPASGSPPSRDNPLQPDPPAERGADDADDSVRHAVMSERDLERLESSLRWLQRQESSLRGDRRRAVPPDYASPLDAERIRFVGERAGSPRSPLSLEPERMAPPPQARRTPLKPLALLAGVLLAAGLGYYAAVTWWAARPQPTEVADRVAAEPASRVAASVAQGEQRLPAAEPELAARHAAVLPSAAAPVLEPAPPPAEPRSAIAPADEPRSSPVVSEEPPARAEPTRTLDAEEIALLVKQGEQLAATGDLVTARVLFQRAAGAGDARAAIALGATYDPVVLAKLGVVGITPDVEQARSWYRKAESFGSAEASRRLAILAKRD
jgi:hypothetical protein